MKTDTREFDRKFLSELARGAQLIFENAEALYNEARILADAGAIARALFLHQISLEECAKVEVMGAHATSILSGERVDMVNLRRVFTSHRRKNRINAYMLTGSPAERAARERGDVKAAIEEFGKLQDQFHEQSNTAKNASLYVDYSEEMFVSPAKRISAQQLSSIVQLNEGFLSDAYHRAKLLGSWADDPDRAQRHVVAFTEWAKTARKASHPKELMDQMRALMANLIQTEREEADSGKF